MRRRLITCVLGAVCLAGSVWAQQATFTHPGLLHSEEDFQHIRERVAAGDAQTLAALEALRTSMPVGGNWGGNWGVNETIMRGIQGNENYMNAYRNAARAYQLALLWKITGETGYANAAIDVLDAYRIYNKGLGGNTNVSLIPGFIGYQFANAAEIMRDYSGWPKENFELFKQYMIDVWFTTAQDFLERRHDTVTREQNWYHYHSNWGVGNALFCVSLGILCDLPDIYSYGMYWLKEGPGNESTCVTYSHPDPYADGLCGYGWGLMPWFHRDNRAPLGYFAQMQESGRDQGHAMAALGLLSYAFQSAYNQGDNAFCNLYNPRIPGKAGSMMIAGAAEYVALFNSMDNGNPEEAEIIKTIPYTQNWWMGALGWTGQGQWRPIWQLFINHFQNRMGLKMTYCQKMKDKIGIERGGGSYGNNSGGYDHTGFGDLMHYDQPVAADKVPSLLFPIISYNGYTRHYAEIRNVEPGTEITLTANLLDDEEDTGNWAWEDGVKGKSRTITADHSGLYRLCYTNANGVKSTQLFCVAVRGEGIRGTLSCTATYNGHEVNTDADILIGEGRKVVFNTSYANWNYIESVAWYDENGKQLTTNGSYTYTLPDKNEHTLTYRLTNESGVVLEKVFHIKYNPNELTNLLGDPDCEKPESWTTNVDGFAQQNNSVTGFTGRYIERFRSATEDGMTDWGQERFNISQTLTGLTPGCYILGAAVVATQQSRTGDAARDFVKDIYLYADGVNTAVSSLDAVSEHFAVRVYVGEDGTMTYGLKNVTNQNRGYSANGANWVGMDNFSLTYEGTDNLAEDLAALRKQAATIQEGSVTDALYVRVKALAGLTEDNLATIVAYQNVVGEALLMQTHYAEYLSEYERFKTFMDESGAKNERLENALKAFAGGETAEEVFAAYEEMQAAWNAFLCDATVPVDMTPALYDAYLKVATADGAMYDPNLRWQSDSEGGSFRVFAIDGSDTQRGEAKGVNQVERWCTANFYPDERLLFQTLTGMPLGRYVFTAAAQKGADGGVINLFVNDNIAPVFSSRILMPWSVSGEVLDGTLTVGAKSGEGNATQWVSFADLDLEYHSPALLLNEALEEAAALTYGEDRDGALQTAVGEARAALAEGVSSSVRMGKYHALLDAMKLYAMNNASPEHPADMTDYVQNAGFDGRTTTGYTLTGGAPGYTYGAMEFYRRTFNLAQTVTGLPVGNYRVTLQARSDEGENNRSFMLFRKTSDGEEAVKLVTGKTRADGTDNSQHLRQNADDLNADPMLDCVTVDALVVDGKLTIGARTESGNGWCVINGFKLEYIGVTNDELFASWNKQVEVATTLDRDYMSLAMDTTLVNATKVDVTGITRDSLLVVLTNLSTTIGEARALMEAFTELRARLDEATEIAENSKPNRETTLTTFVNSITSARNNAEDAMVPADLTGILSNLERARQTYVLASEPINGIGYDMTFRVTNAACTEIAGWLHDGGVNFQLMNNAERDGQYAGTFVENWNGNNAFSGGVRPVYQKLTAVQNGRYVVRGAAFRVNQSGAVADGSLNLYVGNGRTEVISTSLDYCEASGYVSNRTLEFGLVTGTGNTANWVGLADVKLMYYGMDDIRLSESDEDFTAEDGSYGNVTIEQELSSDRWNIISMPFRLTSNETKARFSAVAELSAMEVADGACNLKFKTSRAISAGTPYLVKVAEGSKEQLYELYALNLAAYEKGAKKVTSGEVTATLVPTSVRTAVEGENCYAFDGETFTQLTSGTAVNGFRAYLQLEGIVPTTLKVYVDDVLTGVADVRADDSSETVDVYTVDGMLVKRGAPRGEALRDLRSGVYVINGKKVVK